MWEAARWTVFSSKMACMRSVTWIRVCVAALPFACVVLATAKSVPSRWIGTWAFVPAASTIDTEGAPQLLRISTSRDLVLIDESRGRSSRYTLSASTNGIPSIQSDGRKVAITRFEEDGFDFVIRQNDGRSPDELRSFIFSDDAQTVTETVTFSYHSSPDTNMQDTLPRASVLIFQKLIVPLAGRTHFVLTSKPNSTTETN